MEEVVFESPRVSIAQKVLASFGAGLALAALAAFSRWGFHPGRHLLAWLPVLAPGAAVTVVMLVAVVLGRTVHRVSIEGDRLKLHRDPNHLDVYPLEAVKAFTSEPVVGGWSRDPSERLVLHLADGSRRAYALPDEADTPGIVRDLEALRRAREPREGATNAAPNEAVG
ncbi:MAG: hypothetical protein HY909_29760 [Deltaproteobacteria bacterium]|nr:hypothetical protein [Deltaproteobacteria bacterium]